jgi:hypothetical protein
VSVLRGELTLYEAKELGDCTVEEAPVQVAPPHFSPANSSAPLPAAEGFAYRLRCERDEDHPDKGDPSPGFDLDTYPPRQVLRLTLKPSRPMYVELSVAEMSDPRKGAPLFVK